MFRTLGRTTQLTAEARDGAGNALADRTLSFASTNTGVATVSSTGLVTAVAPGAATITASAEGQVSAPFVVTVAPVAASVAVSPSVIAFATKGRTQQLSWEARDSLNNVLANSPTFGSTNVAAATVSAGGSVTAVADGATKIITTVDGVADTTDVAVVIVVASVTVGPGPIAFGAIGSTAGRTATPRDSLGNLVTGRVPAWSTTDTAIATVNATGLVMSRSAGTTQVSATVDGRSGSATVTVAQIPVAADILENGLTIRTAAHAETLHVTVRDSNGNAMAYPGCRWDRTRAYFTAQTGSGVGVGLVAALENGSNGHAMALCYDAPRSRDLIDSIPVDVDLAVADIDFSTDSLLIHSLGETHFGGFVDDSGGGRRPIYAVPLAFAVRDPLVAVVSPSPFSLQPVADGLTWLVATAANGVRDSVRLRVRRIPLVLIQPSHSGLIAIGALGSSLQLQHAVVDSAGVPFAGLTPTWGLALNNGTVTLGAAGLLTGFAAGTDTILATVPGPDGPVTSRRAVRLYQTPASVRLTRTQPDTLRTIGRNFSLGATVRDSNGNLIPGLQINYYSDNDHAATINNNGRFTARNEGRAIVTAEAGNYGQWEQVYADHTVVVQLYAATFSITPPVAVAAGADVSVIAVAADSSSTAVPVSWVSRNTAVATIAPAAGANAKVHGVATGSVWIVLTGGMRSDSVSVTVN